MLTLIKGQDRVALSAHSFEHIRNSVCASESAWILIVPEQFSFEAELQLCRTGGDTIGRYAEVLSFSRLSDRMAAEQGGIAGEYLDKGGQLLTMALAAEQVSSRIKLYASVLKKPEFLTDVVKMINEFRCYCLLPEDLMKASKQTEGQFSQKLEELGILYEAYLAICANGKADPSDKLTRLLDMLAGSEWVKSRCFYIDGFSDFTGVELKVIEQLINFSAGVFISVPTGEQDSVMHTLADKTADELSMLARKNMVPCKEERLGTTSDRNETVRSVLRHMFSYAEDEVADASEAIQLICCASVAEECRMAAKTVSNLLMAGARCKDICVACSELSSYEVPLKTAFRAANIPTYFAGERELLAKPVVTAVVNSLFAAAGPMDYEDVALYLKSGLARGNREQWDRLDNYAYLWNIKGNSWVSEWKLHPRGFAEQMQPEDETLLALLNEDRKTVLQPLLALRKKLLSAENTGQMVLALHTFLEHIGLREMLENKANSLAEEGKGQAAQELSQIYELLIQSMEQTWLTVGDTVRSAEDFCRLYQSVLTQYQVATIPAGVDQVHISDVPDLRYRQTKHLIVLGAADGKLPSYKTAEGLLTEEERRHLAAQGVAVAPGRADRLEQELSRIYFALTAASESLTLTYTGDQPAWLFRRAAAMCPNAVCAGENEIVLNLHELAAFRLRNEDDAPCAIEELDALQKQLQIARSYSFEPMTCDTVDRLYGMPIVLSPSKIDKYAACKFAFFMNYGLKARPRKQAKLDQPAFGTFVHAVLEHTVVRVMNSGGFAAVTQEEILEIACEEIANYANALFPEQEKRGEYLFERSKAEIRDIVLDIWEELRKSKFSPAYCELKFTGGGELPAVQISGARAACKVVGMVDRVDLYKDGDTTYVRVVDYKTGNKDFDYTDILNGSGLQMLIYLFALQTFGKQLIGTENVEPAGVLYLPARRAYPLTEAMPDDSFVLQKHRELRKRKGLIRGDESLLAAMEEDPNDPVFMPYKTGRKGMSGDLASREQMRLLERHVTRTVASMADSIQHGSVTPDPVVRGQHSSCKYCDYKSVCHKDMGTQKERILAETSAAKFWEMLEREDEKYG